MWHAGNLVAFSPIAVYDGSMYTAKQLLRRLLTVFLSISGFSVITYSVADNKSLWDSIWWAFMTFTTVGYGDQYPTSPYSRFFGIILVVTAVFVVVPVLTALVSRHLIHDEHHFSHDEQEEIKSLLRDIHSTLHK